MCARDLDHPVRVGIDGICGAGKTTFAHDLAQSLTALGRPVVHLDSDGFHHVRAVRYRQGRDSARGYYADGYDFDALRDLALIPLGARPPYRYATRVHDLHSDARVVDRATAPADAVVLFAATFLQRDGLRSHWDEVVFLDTSIEHAQERGVLRDADALGGRASAESAYRSRYMAACRIYLAEQDPCSRASIVVNHDDPESPTFA